MSQIQPEQLLERCRRNDHTAFRDLYTLYARAMFSISMRIVNDRDEAEDILQESFIKAFQNIQKLHTIPEFGGWLKRVVINRSIDTVRKSKFNFISIDNTDVAQEDPGEEPDYDIRTIIDSIQELPDGYRIILTLFLLEDYTHKEIASVLDISEGTSRSQYTRARRKLLSIINQKTNNHVTT